MSPARMCSRRFDRLGVLLGGRAPAYLRQCGEIVARWRRGQVRQRQRKVVDRAGEPLARVLVRGHEIGARRTGLRVHVLDQVQALTEVIEGRHLAREAEHRVGKTLIVGWNRREALDLAHRVVAEPPDDATVERGKLGDHRRAVTLEERLERGQAAGIGRDAIGCGAVDELDPVAAHDERERRVAPEEREPAPTLGVLDRFEQEPFAVAHQLHERRERRLEIGEHLAPDRHHRILVTQ